MAGAAKTETILDTSHTNSHAGNACKTDGVDDLLFREIATGAVLPSLRLLELLYATAGVLVVVAHVSLITAVRDAVNLILYPPQFL